MNIGEPFELMKPNKDFKTGIIYNVESLSIDEFPVYVEKHFAGVRVSIHKDEDDIKMFWGEEDVSQRLPSFVANLKDSKWPQQMVLDAIIEMWLGKKLQPIPIVEGFLSQGGALFEGEDKNIVINVVDVMYLHNDISDTDYEYRRDKLNSLPIGQSTEKVPRTGVFNRGPYHVCNSIEAVVNAMKLVSKAPESKGAMIKSGRYEEVSENWVVYRNIESYIVVTLNKKEARDSGYFNYCLGVKPKEGGKFEMLNEHVFMGKVKTPLDVEVGSIFEVKAESIKVYSNRVRFIMPEVLKVSGNKVMEIDTVVEIAKDSGVLFDEAPSLLPEEKPVEAMLVVSRDSYEFKIPLGEATECWNVRKMFSKTAILSDGKRTIIDENVSAVPVDKVKLEFGTRKEDLYEYFCEGARVNGRLLFRKVDDEWKVWLASTTTPYVLSLDAHDWVPQYGVSALPQEKRENISKRFKYWNEKDEEQRIKVRNTLVKAQKIRFDVERELADGIYLLKRNGKYFTGRSGNKLTTTVTMAEVDEIIYSDLNKGKFTLQKHWWKGLGLDGIGHHDLFVGGKQVVLDDDPTVKGLPFTNEHSCRLESPDKYESWGRKNCEQEHDGKCIDVVYGTTSAGKTEIQSLRYKKSVWDEGAARSHCNSRGGSFEPAKANAQIRKPYSKGFHEKGLKHVEMVKAHSPGNPSNHPSYVDVVDSGDVITVVDEENFKRYNFYGEKLRGTYVLEKKNDKWNFYKEELGGTKKLEAGEILVKHTINLSIDNVELESDNVAIVTGTAFSYGVWNGDYYSPEVVSDRPERILGVPYTVGPHEVVENHGKVIDFQYDDKESLIRSKARVEGKEPVKKLKSGDYPGQSVEITVLEDSVRHVVRKIVSYNRLNAVGQPACVICNVDNIES